MKIVRVASTFLNGPRTGTNQNHNVYESSLDRKPMITPPISANVNSDCGEQYLLVPHKGDISVMSLEHGQHICILSPNDDKGQGGDLTLQTAVIVKLKMGNMSNQGINGNSDLSEDGGMDIDTLRYEFVVLGGFSDGVLREWSLSSIPYEKKTSFMLPRRSFKLGRVDGHVSHLTCPAGSRSDLLYALIASKRGESKTMTLASFTLPACDELSNERTLDAKSCAVVCTRKRSIKASDVEDQNDNREKEVLTKALPFCLVSHAIETGNGENDCLVVAFHKKGFLVYHEGTNSFVSIPKTQVDSDVCAAAISPNGDDVAIGYENGKIDVLTSVLIQSIDYTRSGSDKVGRFHPRDKVVSRTIHWHSLPIKVLTYLGMKGSSASPSLLSAGEEAVLVTWSIDRGLNRPVHTFPRLAKGCITHIATNCHPDAPLKSCTDIIVKSMDETIQLVQTHNHSIRWKLQGLACTVNECVPPVQAKDAQSLNESLPSAILLMDPKSHVPILTRMTGAPGFVHWFDPKSSQVIGELEVAPYNRISRKEVHHKSYPRPTVTHIALSNLGNDMITIDTTLSENTGVGNICTVDSFTSGGNDLSDKMSFATNIKFWAWSKDIEMNAKESGKGMPYELIAAMPAPHGLMKGSIDALGLSPDGSRACTVSFAEGYFHIWAKSRASIVNKMATTSSFTPSWKRLCKIGIPSGYSRSDDEVSSLQGSNLVSFSPDGSVLAIAFGRFITLWDHTNATMLNSIHAPESLRSISFVRSPLDMILAVGRTSISLLPPFGNGYLGKASWTYRLPEHDEKHEETMTLSLVTPLSSRKELAVAITFSGEKKSPFTKVVLVDLFTGEAKRKQDGTIASWMINGSLQSLADISQIKNSSSSSLEDALFIAVTHDNEMLLLKDDEDKPNREKLESAPRGCFARIETATKALTSAAPPFLENHTAKRARMDDKFEMTTSFLQNPMAGTLLFDSSALGSDSGPVPTSQLPALSGSFVRSFISRRINKTS
mmetsp:Transcript_5159/g.9809  ORF Transcript_5159/g.9809 Transcript_5159/m.9809 type:complete len:999 (+) Transcript_5159:218-3214(+)